MHVTFLVTFAMEKLKGKRFKVIQVQSLMVTNNILCTTQGTHWNLMVLHY